LRRKVLRKKEKREREERTGRGTRKKDTEGEKRDSLRNILRLMSEGWKVKPYRTRESTTTISIEWESRVRERLGFVRERWKSGTRKRK